MIRRSPQRPGLLLDIETCPLPEAIDYLDTAAFDEIEPPKNYTKDEAKADYIAREKGRLTREHLAKAALDLDLCRIVVVGYLDVTSADPVLVSCPNEDAERTALEMFWSELSPQADVIGFNILQFDLPILYRRSLYLGVKAPNIQRERFRHDRVIDLMDDLCEQGRFKARSVAFYCKRFGIHNPDTIKGKDIPQLIAAGRWSEAIAHCRYDLFAERSIAERLGVVGPLPVAVRAEVA